MDNVVRIYPIAGSASIHWGSCWKIGCMKRDLSPEDITPNADQADQPATVRSWAEWITFGISSLILIALVGLVGYVWFTREDEPPVLSVMKIAEPREANGQFYVPFEVRNEGGQTVDSVQITAELTIQGEVQETGDQVIDFLSSGEREEGAFIFTQNPAEAELTIRVASYKLP